MKTIQVCTNQVRVMGETGNNILTVVVANEHEMNEVILGLMILLGYNCTIKDQRSIEPKKEEVAFIHGAPYLLSGVKFYYNSVTDQFNSASGVKYDRKDFMVMFNQDW